MRAVLDPNVLVSAVLSPGGTPANLLRDWRAGRFELIVSPQLLDELSRVLAYPKIRRRVPEDPATRLVASLERRARLLPDRTTSPIASADPDDDYLLALAHAARAVLVSGDRDLLQLEDRFPVMAPVSFLHWLEKHAPKE